jgi:hypothetical protein
MKERLINFFAVITIPPSLTINITRLVEYRDLISLVFTIFISFIALLTGIMAYKHWKIKKEIAEIEMEQKRLEYQNKKEDHQLKEKNTPKDPPGFFKNNVIK